MSIPQKPPPAKLVIGLFMGKKVLFTETIDQLAHAWGAIDMVSPWLPFNQTEYYYPEIGFPLFRRLVAFEELVQQETLAEIKLFTNKIERRFSQQGKRAVNIDPGYLLAERFVLATGKNFTHRIYLQKGIYADLTLIYQKGRFRPLAWTYPDYAGAVIIGFLTTIRDRYLYQLRTRSKVN